MESVKVILMTRSSKHGGFCVAGIDVATGRWIRLVTGDERLHGAVPASEMCHCAPLDLVEIPVLRPAPTRRQPENVLLDRSHPWRRIARCSTEQVLRFVPPRTRGTLFGNRLCLLTGQEDNDHSLTLVAVTDLTLRREGKLKCDFDFAGSRYRSISVTDPDYYDPRVPSDLPRAVLVVSLADEALDGKYFKFAAKIFPEAIS